MLIGGESAAPARSIVPMPYPDNDRELIVDVLVGTLRGATDHWTCLPGPGCEAVKPANGYTPLVMWQAREPGGVMTLRGRSEASVEHVALLRVRVMAGRDQTVQLRAEVDGRWIDVGEPTVGVDDYTEVDGPIRGRRLSAVEVVCTATSAGAMTNGVMWVMTVLAGQRTPWPIPSADWPGMLRDRIDVFEPTIGLDGEVAGFEKWRQHVQSPALAAIWQRQVALAEAEFDAQPETYANPITPYSKERFGRPDAPDRAPFPKAMVLATVGLVQRRPDMLRLAARWALTWAQCKRWVQYGLEAVEGIGYNHGRFGQSIAARCMSVLFDHCGCALTDEGKATVAHAIRHLGVLDIDPIMRPGSYVWNMNQGIAFDIGRLLGAIATDRWYPGELDRRLDDSQAMLASVLSKAFRADGGAEEGTSYWSYTLGYVPWITTLLARFRGGRPGDYLPANVAASAIWALTNLRTDSDTPLMLTHGDSHYDRALSPTLAAFFAGPLGIEAYTPIARQAYPASIDRVYLEHAAQAGCVDGGDAPTEAVVLPTLTVFREIEQVDVRQREPRSGMRIYFLSGDRAGHGHDDRNTFMLEAFGQPMLIDRATPSYTHPATAVCKLTDAHNGIAPDGHTQMADVHEPSATLTQVREEPAGRVVIESDASAAWRDWSVRVVRRLTHLRPDVLVVEDVARWSRPTVTNQYWQSLAPWRQVAADAWEMAWQGVELQMRITGDVPMTMNAERYSVDGNLRPVRRLTVATERGDAARLVTVMQVRQSAAQAWPIEIDRLHMDETGIMLMRDGQGIVAIERIAAS